MTWGLTTLRDKWPNVQAVSTFKGVALLVLSYDLADALGSDVEVVQTRLFKGDDDRRPDLSKYEGLVIAEHPFGSGKGAGYSFTTAPSEQNYNQIRAVASFTGPLRSWNCKSTNPNWAERAAYTLARKCSLPESCVVITEAELMPALTCEGIDDLVTEVKANRRHHIYGDSHAYSVWEPQASIFSLQGKTLYRVLSDGLSSFLAGNPSQVSFNFGNTDLRHHIGRQPNPHAAAIELAEEYIRQARSIKAEVTLYGLLPNIEDDSRFYKSYRYQDEFHFGSVEERDDMRARFNDTLLASGLRVLMPPKTLEDENGHLLRTLHEPRGPHLRPGAMPWSPVTDEPNAEYLWE